MRRVLLLMVLCCGCVDLSRLKDCSGGTWYCADFEDGGFGDVRVIATHALPDTALVEGPGHDSSRALNLNVPYDGGINELSLEWDSLPNFPPGQRDWFMRAFVRVPRAHDPQGPVLLAAYRSADHAGTVRLFLRGTTLTTDGNANPTPEAALAIGQWSCLEWEVLEAERDGAVRAWVDGQLALEWSGTTTLGTDGGQLGKLKLGAQLDGGVHDGGFQISYDDVVTAGERIGCDPLRL